jgi:GNAT superfamily N-acetyltransferase
VNPTGTIAPRTGPPLGIRTIEYPASTADALMLTGLWRTEWTRGDFEWLSALGGEGSETLRWVSVVAFDADQPVSTATIAFPRRDPEVCVVANVVTLRSHRGRGIGSAVTAAVVEVASAAGCRVAYLGSRADRREVYARAGFRPVSGVVMRRAVPPDSDPEAEFFAPGQRARVREVEWGDLPGFACLCAQPWPQVFFDYPRGLASGLHGRLDRCVSGFTVVREDVAARGGVMYVMAGEGAHRVIGFGTLTPGPGWSQAHVGVLDLAIAESYQPFDLARPLVAAAKSEGLSTLMAYVASSDALKRRWLQSLDLSPVTRLPGAVRTPEGVEDAEVFVGSVR